MFDHRRLFCSLLLASGAASRWIVPGGRWLDTDGNRVNAHAGNVYYDEPSGKYWLYGEYKTEETPEGGGISAYSSPDLVTWEFHGLALDPEEQMVSPSEVVQRPKVTYSDISGLYHMWWHADNENYTALLQGFATSPVPEGPYSFVSATAPLGNWSQDFGMFTDYKSGKTYALYSNGDTVEGRDNYVTRYNANVSELEEVVYRFPKFDLEAPTIIQTEKSYYCMMSHKTGYRPNNVVAFRADSLEGPWSQPWIIAPLNTRTYNSQSGYSLRIVGSEATTYLYMGDQWDLNSIWDARYLWVPMNIDDDEGDLSLEWHDVYDLNVETGVVTPIRGQTYYSVDAEVSGDAYHQEANFAANNSIVTGIYGNESKVTFTGIEGSGELQWVSFYYQNIDDMGFGDQPQGSPDRIGGTWKIRRIGSVIVNDDPSTLETLYARDTHKGIILSTPLQLKLEQGSHNTITIGGLNNSVEGNIDFQGPDIDRLIVHPPEPAAGEARKHHGQMEEMYCPANCRSHGLAVCDIPGLQKSHRGGGNGHMGGCWNSAPGEQKREHGR
ncbi:glycoside hydrolase family 43 protein [Hortaea werneckii]|uniref:Glycosyl hydrolase family 43 protein n=1 Tax=Hortaea werneckii TaxID=91943 RepID=A0A3M7FI01_HORWE|nr:glycoside hydrolase family 43 protein [Hortaea werneckii]KAI6884721.1 glycoside hydrolase family 43 protein [Hortaea werneckii]KAI6994835.1 glycoside hydrolase family 43 protein [Hortaea werneckii]KAI7146015.1 glycoside hydrolase family 43 protein [Hortaea werneckii]KAI7173855.1 glycoside hydrolase family 43 protein [Hortaea werneckii]